jgi:putative membrane protein
MKSEVIDALSGVGPFLLYFIPAILLVLVFMWIYTKFTPYNEGELIRENNVAAAITYVGALLGFTFPLASALANSVSVIDFAVWAVIAGIAQLVTFLVFRAFYPKIAERVKAGEIAATLKLAGWSVMVGVLNAAAITY